MLNSEIHIWVCCVGFSVAFLLLFIELLLLRRDRQLGSIFSQNEAGAHDRFSLELGD